MNKMNRFTAWIVLLAILLSSFAFAEEILPAETPALVEIIAEEASAEAPAVVEIIAEEASAETPLLPLESEAALPEAVTVEETVAEAEVLPAEAENAAYEYAVSQTDCTHWQGEWKDTGDGYHQHHCSLCGFISEKQPHYSSYGENKCWYCKAVGVCLHEKINYMGDHIGHRQQCSQCLEFLSEVVPHVYKNDRCVDCKLWNNCWHESGYEWIDNGNGTHSECCVDCKEAFSEKKHTFSGGSCTKCGAAEPPCEHKYTKATDLGNGKHALSCSNCGFDMGEEEHYGYCWTSSTYCIKCSAQDENIRKTHDYRCENDYNGYGTHVMKCDDCDQVDEATHEAHTYDENNICTGCGFELNEHYCSSNCDRPNVCSLCGQACDEVSHKYEYVEYCIKFNEYFHGDYCSKCDVFFSLSAHYVVCGAGGGKICSEKYGCGATVDAKYVNVQHGPKNGVQIDPANPDYHYFTCRYCGKKISELHNVFCGNTYLNCYQCGATVEEPKRHSPDMSEKPVVYPSDASKHGWACSCGEIVYPTAHSYKNGVCTGCGIEKQGLNSVEFGTDEIKLLPGDTAQAKLIISGAASKTIYKSSNTGVASVDADGLITAKKAGAATITATVTGVDGESMSAKLNVSVQAVPSKVTLSVKKLTLGVGENSVLEPTFAPKNAYTLSSWTSSDEAVAVVDENGTVTAAGEGTAFITIETYNGKTASCTVTVLGAPANLSVDVAELTLNPKKSYTLKTEVTSAAGNACAGNPVFESSDTSVVTVDAKGKITAKATGSAIVTVSTYNGLSHEVQVSVFNLPKKVTLNTTKESLDKGATLQLTASIAEDEATTFSWTSGNKKVASVDENGLVTALAEGSATITVKTANGKKASCKLTVVDPYKPSGIELAESGTVILPLGESLALNASLLPATAQSELTWTSSSKKVAEVDENGVVTPLKEGTATITVTTYNKKKDTVKVQVVGPNKAAAVELDVSGTVELSMGSTLQLNAAVLPATAETTLSWTTSSKKVAEVDENGLVTALKKGTATITVKTANGKKDTVKIKVVE